MSREATVRTSLLIRKGELYYQSNPTQFIADVTNAGGPTPGAVTVAVLGTDVSLAQLTTPGLCRLMNLDSTNYVEYGVYVPGLTEFIPLGELLPGETYVLRLSRFLGKHFGTGTYQGSGITFRMLANSAPCKVLVEAFEK